MSKSSKTTASELDFTEIQDIESRVTRVKKMLNNSSVIWLQIAKEFVEAKVKLRQLGYERFVNDSGFTKSVADKLICIGKCKRLYDDQAKEIVGVIDGWTTLYEVTKLNDSQIDDLFAELRKKKSLRLSRSVVFNIANGNAATDKMLVFVTIGAQESLLGNLTDTQIDEFRAKLDELRTMFNKTPKAIVFKQRKDALKLLSDVSKSNNSATVVQTAA
jgi:hypothetical protein